MAITNFRASDFPKGKKGAEETHNDPREDNKILAKSLDNAVRDPKEGEKFAKEFAKKVDEADKKLNEEISRTETPLDEQKTEEKKAPARKSSVKKSATKGEGKPTD